MQFNLLNKDSLSDIKLVNSPLPLTSNCYRGFTSLHY